MKKYTHIAVIDSGASSLHNWGEKIVGGVTVSMDESGQISYLENIFEDNIGHGTAVADGILKVTNNCVLTCIKIFDQEFAASMDLLIASLVFIKKNVDCDIIHISSGVTYIENYPLLVELLEYFSKKNVIVVSAFDNNGAISYPAACPQVIGVDTCDMGEERRDFIITKNGVIDLIVSNCFHRLKWVSPAEIIIRGSSFSVCHITAKISEIIYAKQRRFKKEEILLILGHSKHSKIQEDTYSYKDPRISNWYRGKNFIKNVNKAVVFPFNKEIHPLAIYENDLPFQIIGYYDIRQHGKIGKNIASVFPFAKTSDHVIRNIDHLDWNSDFDMIICGHCSKIGEITAQNYQNEIIEKAKKHTKKLYSFDKIMDIDSNPSVFYPHITKHEQKKNRRGKLRNRTTPVIGVFGTSSSQGKFTYQLELRKRFLKNGYQIAQISTEPNGYLFGMDGVYPMGYNAAVDVHQAEAVAVMNEMIWEVTACNTAEVLIVGGQSGTVTYNYSNLAQYNFAQNDFLNATTPDVFALCINPHDDMDYIERTIFYLKSFGNTSVAVLILYPVELSSEQLGFGVSKKRLSQEQINQYKKRFMEHFKLPVFVLGQEEEMEQSYQVLIDSLSSNDF